MVGAALRTLAGGRNRKAAGDDHGDAGCGGGISQGAKSLKAVAAGHHDIHDDQLGALGERQRKDITAVRGKNDFVESGIPQAFLDVPANVRFIIYHKNPFSTPKDRNRNGLGGEGGRESRGHGLSIYNNYTQYINKGKFSAAISIPEGGDVLCRGVIIAHCGRVGGKRGVISGASGAGIPGMGLPSCCGRGFYFPQHRGQARASPTPGCSRRTALRFIP